MQSYTILLSTQHNNTDPRDIHIYEKYRHRVISQHILLWDQNNVKYLVGVKSEVNPKKLGKQNELLHAAQSGLLYAVLIGLFSSR